MSFTTSFASPSEPLKPLEALCAGTGVVLGTEGSDVLEGSAGDDVICGLGGDDVIYGLGGDDIVIGGSGNDLISGATGDDELLGGVGNDTVKGDLGDDKIWGDLGDDDVSGGNDNDYISGGPGADNLYGENGLDALFAGLGNDGLDGGEGVDFLDGQGGNDTCVVTPGDTKTRCFFDNHPPVLTSISIDPATSNIDVSTSNREVRLRVAVSDPGTGVSSFGLEFWPKKSRSDPRSAHVFGLGVSDAKLTCADIIRYSIEGERYRNSRGEPTNCLLSGTPNRGIYELSVLVPPNVKPGTFVVSRIYSVDLVRNESVLSYKKIDSAHLGVSVNQIGPDVVPGPQIHDIRIIGSHVMNSQNTRLLAELNFTDIYGLRALELRYKNDLNDVAFQGTGPIYSFAMCQSETASGCLAEGTRFGGRYRFAITLKADVYTPREFLPAELKVSDSYFGITKTEFDLQEIENLRFSTNFNLQTPAPDPILSVKPDSSAPVIKSLQFNTKLINTSSTSRKFSVKIAVADKGSGINMAYPEVVTYWAHNTATNMHEGIYCEVTSKSGTPNNAQITLTCEVPAHYPSGKIILNSIEVSDQALISNHGGIMWNQIKAKFGQWYVING